ncbi:hypothetical protein B0T41_22235 [Chromobacterium violaceum]|nr:hypothetical protein B0T41_22235 [Chromobacterium violaceum]
MYQLNLLLSQLILLLCELLAQRLPLLTLKFTSTACCQVSRQLYYLNRNDLESWKAMPISDIVE